MECDCTPGTEENGWAETVGPNCHEKDLDLWREVAIQVKAQHYRNMVDRLYRERVR